MFAQKTRTVVPSIARWARFNTTTVPPASASQLPSQPSPAPAELSERELASQVVHGRGLLPPHYHARTHSIPAANIHFRSYHPHLLDLFIHFTSHAAAALAIPISKAVHLPTQRSLWTVPRGPFAHKKSQENFERKVHKRCIKAWDTDEEVIDRWVKYLERHAMAGVGIRVTRWVRAPVGVGNQLVEKVLGQMRMAQVTSKQKVEALGKTIVEEELKALADEPAPAPPPESAPAQDESNARPKTE